jgi:hypothetical protein
VGKFLYKFTKINGWTLLIWCRKCRKRSNNFTVVPWFCLNINCEDLHPEITALIDESKIPSRNRNGFEYYY